MFGKFCKFAIKITKYSLTIVCKNVLEFIDYSLEYADLKDNLVFRN